MRVASKAATVACRLCGGQRCRRRPRAAVPPPRWRSRRRAGEPGATCRFIACASLRQALLRARRRRPAIVAHAQAERRARSARPRRASARRSRSRLGAAAARRSARWRPAPASAGARPACRGTRAGGSPSGRRMQRCRLSGRPQVLATPRPRSSKLRPSTLIDAAVSACTSAACDAPSRWPLATMLRICARLFGKVELGQQAAEVLEHRADEGLFAVARDARTARRPASRPSARAGTLPSAGWRAPCPACARAAPGCSAMLRMPAKPTSATARDTVLMLPPPACAVVRGVDHAQQLVGQRHVLQDLARQAGQALVSRSWRRAGCAPPSPTAPGSRSCGACGAAGSRACRCCRRRGLGRAGRGVSHWRSASRRRRRWRSAAPGRARCARRSDGAQRVVDRRRQVRPAAPGLRCATRCIARYGSRSAISGWPLSISTSTRPAANTSIAGVGAAPRAASGDM